MDKRLVVPIRVTATILVGSMVAWYTMAQVKVTYEDEAQARQRAAGQIGAELALRLPAILEDFQARRRLLRHVGEGYEPEDLSALLTSTETSLRGALEVPDLAPLRDYVAEFFRAARERLRLPRAAAFASPHPATDFRQASFQAGMSRSEADAIIDRIVALMQSILSRAKSRELVVTLCVVSRLEGTQFAMSALSLPGKLFETVTNGEVVNAFRGLYSYTIKRGSQSGGCAAPPAGKPWGCRPVDLWDDPPVLDCDLGSAACRPRNREPGDCRGSGR